MSNIWDQTINIDDDLIKFLIKHQMNIDVNELKLIGEGFDNLAYLVNQEYIFRFPRRDSGVTCMESEIAILPYIAEHVSFPLTAPKFIGVKSDDYPYPFAGYKIIKGKALCDACPPLVNNVEFAQALGKWLKELHSVPVKIEHLSIVAPEQNLWRLDTSNRIKALTDSINKYKNHYTECGFDKEELLRLVDNFSHLEFSSNKDVYLHGDLYSRHIIKDDNLMPTGLIDWGDMHIGHPGIDLSICAIFDDVAEQEFIDTYGGVDDETMKVAIFRALCHSAISLPYACQQNESGFKEWTIAVLKREIEKFKRFI